MTTGFVDRVKGKMVQTAASLQQMGTGGAVSNGGGTINQQVSAAGISQGNDATEDTLFTYSMPGKTLDTNNRSLLINAWGSLGATAHSKTVKLYFGSELISSGAVTTSGGGWMLSLSVMRTGAATQTILGQTIVGTVHGGCTVQAGAESDTQAITIKVTGQTATTATGDVICYGLNVEMCN